MPARQPMLHTRTQGPGHWSRGSPLSFEERRMPKARLGLNSVGHLWQRPCFVYRAPLRAQRYAGGGAAPVNETAHMGCQHCVRGMRGNWTKMRGHYSPGGSSFQKKTCTARCVPLTPTLRTRFAKAAHGRPFFGCHAQCRGGLNPSLPGTVKQVSPT